MTTEQFRETLKSQPFRRFTIELADGTKLAVAHPECAMLSRSGRTAVVAMNDDTFRIIDLLLFSSLHVGNGQRPRRSAQ